MRTTITFAAVVATIAGLAALEVRAGGDKIAFPESYASGVVYMTLDRAGSKQITEYYVSPEAIDAARKGMPLPSGTVITAVAVGAQLDAQGNPVKDTNGRFIKTSNITGYRVMAKRTGWSLSSAMTSWLSSIGKRSERLACSRCRYARASGRSLASALMSTRCFS